MGCGNTKDRQDDDLRIDEIEEKKQTQPKRDENAVESFHPRNRYAADTTTAIDDDDFSPGDELADERRRKEAESNKPMKKKKKKRDDDEDDDDEDGAAAELVKDQDMERLLASYKEKPKASAFTSTLVGVNKHTQAMKRSEQLQQQQQHQNQHSRPPDDDEDSLHRSTPIKAKVNMNRIFSHDDDDILGEEDLNNTNDDQSHPDEDAYHISPVQHGNWNVDDIEDVPTSPINQDIAALQSNGFKLTHKSAPKVTAPSPPPKNRSPGARVTPSLEDRKSYGGDGSGGGMMMGMPGMIEDDTDSSQEFGGGSRTRKDHLKHTSTSNALTLDASTASTQPQTRTNSYRGNKTNGRGDDDEFSF